MRGFGRYYELHLTCEGEVDPVTGYFVNIKHIDTAVRQHVVPWLDELIHASGDGASVPQGKTMRELIARLQSNMAQSILAARLNLTPYLSLTIERADMGSILIRQQFEFAAAHRLHVDELSDDENQRVFGKCNNPSGHGHNYRVEVAVRAPINQQGHCCNADDIDKLVDDAVIEKLDHKHLNIDVPEFADLNPSVENIAKVIFEMLVNRTQEISVSLDEVSVWETGKTMCTYRGDAVEAHA